MAKSGRRVQANARTLSFAVRQYFRPALREIQAAGSTPPSEGGSGSTLLEQPAFKSAVENSATRSASVSTPECDLIPTQPDQLPASTPVKPSEKSLGKRKRVETDDHDQTTDSASKSTGVVTRFTQAHIPPALKKCTFVHNVAVYLVLTVASFLSCRLASTLPTIFSV